MYTEELPQDALLDALRAGDAIAFRQLFEQYYPGLVSGLRRFVGEDQQCKDIVQDVFVELWNKRENLQIHTNLGAYLRKASVNKALNHLKQTQRFSTEDADRLPETADPQAELLQAQDALEIREQALADAIEALPEKCRQVFVLSRFENMSHKQIAAELGISTKTIENQITKAMRLLREALLKGGGMSPAVISMLIWYLST